MNLPKPLRWALQTGEYDPAQDKPVDEVVDVAPVAVATPEPPRGRSAAMHALKERRNKAILALVKREFPDLASRPAAEQERAVRWVESDPEVMAIAREIKALGRVERGG
jgi:hypothetical protein